MTTTLIIIALIAIITGFVGYKLWSANREIERVLKVNTDLEQTNHKQAAEISVKNTQISHHQTRIKNEEKTSNTTHQQLVDELHNSGDLRD